MHFLDCMYDGKYKHSWCVTLNDDEFDKYYKMITGDTHVSVNYNGVVLFDELYCQRLMLCFMGLFDHEIRSANIMQCGSVNKQFLFQLKQLHVEIWI